jgi:CYTH domain-containing protein
MEIERKFLIAYLPEHLETCEKHEIAQGYISTSPVIRIRKLDESHILTVKSKGLLSREEFELSLTEAEFQKLSEKVEGNMLSKTRYRIPESEGLTIELDVFHGAFQGLCYGEIEFASEEDAKKYNPPAYFGREVTYDSSYHNSSLSTMDKDSILLFVSKVRTKNC